MITRRRMMTSGLAALAVTLRGGRAQAGAFEDILARIEGRSGGRLGVAVLDTASGELTGRRLDERFPLCSTFKTLAAAAVLARVDGGQESLDRRIVFEREALVPYSPVTEARVGGSGMSLAELCEAAVTRSDNAAANLLLRTLGGPAGLTAHLHAFGDRTTRLDRTEPTLNEAAPGDPRDTTSPAAMVRLLAGLTLGSALSQPSRDRLTGWLLANTTGGARLRAGLPPGWRIGEKTGTGENGTTNDAGVIWPPDGAAQVVAVYLTGSDRPLADREAALANVAKAVVDT
ncbi:class A beta-lactamase [Methylobacterium sp. Leaf456]|uniref:class A beta-lactamase n=1 Tax=Methylobacterium sp. Leaf456 TaxID=1736382 RepID=UPI0006F7D754|nr:class A beta-lactamase [Methylobacterium sp. Leaf456]KQT53427.1 class A beta-lactamase [Methylobacterium sp. Leaf456]